ncbi:MAG: lamin tail domain-containing protein, partial [Planctomycetota bacterium]
MHAAVLTLTLWAGSLAAPGGVVINEILYRAPDDLSVEFIELYNSGADSVDLSGWKLTNAVKFEFPKGTTIAADSYLVVTSDATLFAEFYPDAKAIGTYKGSLGNGGDSLILFNRLGQPVDFLTYDDRAPWPLSADGSSASLERICPSASG